MKSFLAKFVNDDDMRMTYTNLKKYGFTVKVDVENLILKISFDKEGDLEDVKKFIMCGDVTDFTIRRIYD